MYSMQLEAFSDVDWGGDVMDRRSHSGYIVRIGGNLILWQSKKQIFVARSTTKAQYKSLANTTFELIWIWSVLLELGISVQLLLQAWCDNIGANCLTVNPISHSKAKHVAINYHFVREHVADNTLEVKFVMEQVADLLTKALPKPGFHYLFSKLICSLPMSLRGGVKQVVMIITVKLLMQLIIISVSSII